MTQTTLAFYRKEQTLASLLKERPKSLETVRQCVEDALEQLERDISLVQNDFLQGRTFEEEIRHLLPDLRYVMKHVQVSYIHAAWQIDFILQKAQALSGDVEIRELSVSAARKTKAYHEKLLEYVPDQFQPLSADILEIRQIMCRYFKSFIKDVADPYLESARHYELKIRELSSAIDMHLRNIQIMSDAYRSENGLKVKHFGLTSNELARRCDVGDLPFVLMFAEACLNVNNARLCLVKWLEEDIQYVGYVRSDISLLENKRRLQGKIYRDAQQKAVQLDKKAKGMRKDIEALSEDIRRMKHREVALNKEINALRDDIKFIRLDIEEKEKEIESLKYSKSNRQACSKRSDAILIEITGLCLSITPIEKQINQLLSKKSIITEKRNLIANKQEVVTDIENEAKDASRVVEREHNEISRLETCLGQLKEIIMCRTCPGVTKKIFHNIPVEAHAINRTGHSLTKKKGVGDLEVAIRVTSQEIEHDWPKLYRLLPFKPPRGRANIEIDICDVIKEQYRSNTQVHAFEALTRWRRLHSYATLDELKHTLAVMNRTDVVRRIEHYLSSQQQQTTQRTIPKKVNITPVKKYKQIKLAVDKFMAVKGPYRLNRSVGTHSLLVDGPQQETVLKEHQPQHLDVTATAKVWI